MDILTAEDVISVRSLEEEVRSTPPRRVMNPLAGRKRGTVVQAVPPLPQCGCDLQADSDVNLAGVQLAMIAQTLITSSLMAGVYFIPVSHLITLPAAFSAAIIVMCLCVIYVTTTVRSLVATTKRDCCVRILDITLHKEEGDGFSTSDDESIRQMSDESDVSSDGPRCWASHVRHNKSKKSFPLESRKGSVVCTGIDQWKVRELANLSAERLGAQATCLLQQVIDTVNKNHGMMHGMYGERFYYSFNTWRATYSHQQAAAMTALQLSGVSGAKDDDICLTLTSSVSCGQLTCGSIGSEGYGRHFMVLGAPTSQADALQTLAMTSLRARVVADGRVYRSCIGCFVFRVVDSVMFDGPNPIPETLYELLASKAANSKEWMYYENTPYDTAVTHLLRGDFAAALDTFNTIPASDADGATLRMKGFAENKHPPPYTMLS